MKRRLDNIEKLVEESVPQGGPYTYPRVKEVASYVSREAVRRFGKKDMTIPEQAERLGVKITSGASHLPADGSVEMLPPISAEEREKYNYGDLPASLIQIGRIKLTRTHLSDAMSPTTVYRIMGATMQSVQTSPEAGLDKSIDDVIAAGVLPAEISPEYIPLLQSAIAISYDLAVEHFNVSGAGQVNSRAA